MINDAESWVLGIDGGGSGSRALAVSTSGEVLGEATGGPLNFYTTSDETFRSNLTALYRELDTALGGQRMHATLGTAALLDVPDDQELSRVLADVEDPESWTVVGDSVTAVYGATAGDPGVLVIAGTGSIAVALDANGNCEYRGGFGPLIGGDPGSAFWMASRAVLAAQDDPELAARVNRFFGTGKLTGVIPRLYVDGFDCPRLASLSEFLAAQPHLESWSTIEEAAGREIAALVAPLERLIGAGPSIFGAGSVLDNNQRVRQSVERELCVSVLAPTLDATTGAALLALERSGAASTDAALRLRESRS